MQPQTPGDRFAPLDPRPPPELAPGDRALPQADGLPLSVAAVARKLGIAPATLRTWDRRYGIGPSDHVPGTHRRYSADDLARLELMRNALLHGATPAAAATYALTTPLPAPDAVPLLDTTSAATTAQAEKGWAGPVAAS